MLIRWIVRRRSILHWVEGGRLLRRLVAVWLGWVHYWPRMNRLCRDYRGHGSVVQAVVTPPVAIAASRDTQAQTDEEEDSDDQPNVPVGSGEAVVGAAIDVAVATGVGALPRVMFAI